MSRRPSVVGASRAVASTPRRGAATPMATRGQTAVTPARTKTTSTSPTRHARVPVAHIGVGGDSGSAVGGTTRSTERLGGHKGDDASMIDDPVHAAHRGVLGLVSPDVLESKLGSVAKTTHVIGAGAEIPVKQQRLDHINVVSAPTSPVRAIGTTLRRSPEIPNAHRTDDGDGDDDDNGGGGSELPSDTAHFLGIHFANQIHGVLMISMVCL